MSITNQLVASDDPILKAVAVAVQPGEWLEKTMRCMKQVVARSKSGLGLAAPQIGVSKRLIYINVQGRELFLINPEIEERNGVTSLYDEGCLSYPGTSKVIARDTWIKVTYEDVSRVKHQGVIFQDIAARVVLHEIDHLNGICRVGDDSPADGVIRVPVRPKMSAKGAMLMIGMLAATSLHDSRR
jgi:peptide deformylase